MPYINIYFKSIKGVLVVKCGSRPFRQCGTSPVAVDNRFGKTGSRFGSTTAETVAPNVLHRHRRYSPYTCTAETVAFKAIGVVNTNKHIQDGYDIDWYAEIGLIFIPETILYV